MGKDCLLYTSTEMHFYFGPNHFKTLKALDKGRTEKWEMCIRDRQIAAQKKYYDSIALVQQQEMCIRDRANQNRVGDSPDLFISIFSFRCV